MPARRRKFSVQNNFGDRNNSTVHKASETRHPHSNLEIKLIGEDILALNTGNKKNRNIRPSSSKNASKLDIVVECDSDSSITTVKKVSITKIDKDVTAHSSNIDLDSILNVTENPQETSITQIDTVRKKRCTRQTTREKSPLKRDKHPRQHRVKVRSPKRRIAILDGQSKTNDVIQRTVGTATIEWDQEQEICSINNVTSIIESIEDEVRSSDSLDDMCRICHGGDVQSVEFGLLISACACRGTVGRVHVKCLERWLTESGKLRCELCGTRYSTRRVHKYGVLRAFIMWILSQNAKQLMVDSLGIMLMSPLAVLAAWLSGRTLTGLITQDNQPRPWPLASTFVLACMTLVCYYCWIVSAATRHALSWWIWYRSQYEVRLELQENED